MYLATSNNHSSLKIQLSRFCKNSEIPSKEQIHKWSKIMSSILIITDYEKGLCSKTGKMKTIQIGRPKSGDFLVYSFVFLFFKTERGKA